METRCTAVSPLEPVQRGCVIALQSGGGLSASMSCMAAGLADSRRKTFRGVRALQLQRDAETEAPWPNSLQDSNPWRDTVENKKKWPEQNFRPEAAAEDGQLACTQAYTPTSWPTNEAGLDQTNGSAANGLTSSGEQAAVERLWQNYFECPDDWWDNRNRKLNPRSPDFKHKTSKDALWVDSRDTPQWVRQALASSTPTPSNAGGGSSESPATLGDERRSGTGAGSRFPQRTVFSWTALISQHAKSGQSREALNIYEQMLQDGVEPNSYTFVAVLKACTTVQDLGTVQKIHSKVMETGCESDPFVGTTLVHVYANLGRLATARGVFDKLSSRNVASWNAMISGYVKVGQAGAALGLYTEMRKEGVQAEDRTYVATLKACSCLAVSKVGSEGEGNFGKKQCLEQVRDIHADIRETGSSELSVFVGTTLIDAYTKCGSLVDARSVFEKMPQRNAATWMAMILGYAQTEEGEEETFQVHAWMEQEGLLPDGQTLVSVLKACSSLAGLEDGNEKRGKYTREWCLEQVRAVHSKAVTGRLEGDVHLGTTLVDLYMKCGSSVEARSVFEKLHSRNLVSWNAIILGYAKLGRGEEAWQLYSRMQLEGCNPTEATFFAVLKACASMIVVEDENKAAGTTDGNSRCLEMLRAIQSDMVNSRVELKKVLGTNLMNLYAQCGSLVDARSVFEKLPQRDVVSWNTMILSYAHAEDGEEALQLYTRMKLEGVARNDKSFIGVLKACFVLAALEEGEEADGRLVKRQSLTRLKAVHLDVVNSAGEANVIVGATLINAYAKCGSLIDALNVFERFPRFNVATWNAIILGCAQLKESEESLRLYNQMYHEGVAPNDRTFVGALTACKWIIYQEQRLEQVRSIHSDVVNAEFESDTYVGNMLIDSYAKCGRMAEARSVFEKMSRRNVVSWTLIMSGYIYVEEGREALCIYERMHEEGVVPDDQTIVCALKACRSLTIAVSLNEGEKENSIQECLEQTRAIHAYVVKCRPRLDNYVGNMLMDVYAHCGCLEDARCVFESMPIRDVVSWSTIISQYAELGEGEDALYLYAQMQQQGVLPNERTYLAALEACSSLVASVDATKGEGKRIKDWCLDQARAIHSDVVRTSQESNILLETMLVDVFAKCESLVEARAVFDNMPYRNCVSWSAMILGYSKMGQNAMALQMFDRMQQEGVIPNDRTFIGALKACGNLAVLQNGKQIHAQISNVGLQDSVVATTLIDMYSKCGSMEDAWQVFNGLQERDVVTWNALMAGYARRGDMDHVLDLFRRMVADGVRPDGPIFTSILSACCHVGAVEEGRKYFFSMSRDYGITPTIDHYTIMVDLLGGVGHLDEAMAMVDRMPFEPDGVVWRTILGACRKWRNVELGRQAFEAALRLDGNDSGAYVLMANIYAAANMLDDAEEVHAMRLKAAAAQADLGQMNCG